MGLIGREIIQTRIWKNEPEVPHTGNYKEVFPITVFDAVKREYNSTETLVDIINQMELILSSKQQKIPAKGSDQLVTYAGQEGQVGSIGITTRIRREFSEPSDDLIPTERAVANYLIDLGFVNQEGEIDLDQKIRWANVIGRPLWYKETGNNQDGFMTQQAVTEAINSVRTEISSIHFDDSEVRTMITNHTSNSNNPHNVTLDQLDGVSTNSFIAHTEDTNNPHQVTKEQLGLSNVNNTSDLDKPISTAVQNELTTIEQNITNLITATEQLAPALENLSQIAVSQTDFNLHVDDLNNPHQVTKTQLGLSNVDNTSDADKPISTAVQLRLQEIDQNLTALETTLDTVTDYLTPTGENLILISTDNSLEWGTISSNLIDDDSISTNKIQDLAVTTNKIADANIDSSKLASNLVLMGKPTLFEDLPLTDNSKTFVTSEWVNSQIFGSSRIEDRAINGNKLFTTENANTVLSVLTPNTDPVYTKISHEMLNSFIIEANNIKNFNVTELKLADNSVSTAKLQDNSVSNEKLPDGVVTTNKILDNAVTSSKLFKASQEGMVLISNENKVPVYKKLSESDIEINVQSLPVNKLQSIDQSDRVLAVITNNSDPIWTKINSDMLRDKIVDGSKLFTSPVSNRVLAVETMYEDPFYTQVNTEMIKNGAVTSEKIQNGSILYDHLGPTLLSSDFIESANIKDESIIPSKLFRSELPNRVIGTIGDPYSEPQWLQVNRAMIEDEAINGDKLWTSGIEENPYRVIGVTGPDVPPEYLMITGNFIVNSSIPGNKLIPNIVLSGSPALEIDPPSDSNDHSLVTTGWVTSKLSGFQDQLDLAIQNVNQALLDSLPSATDEEVIEVVTEIWSDQSSGEGENG